MSYANKVFTVTALGLVLGCSAPVFAHQHYSNTKPLGTKSRNTLSKVRRKKGDRVKVDKTSANPTRLPRLLRKHIAVMKATSSVETFMRHYRLANSIPGYRTLLVKTCDKKAKKCERDFITVKKKAGGSVAFNDYGTSSKIGHMFFGVGGHVNDLFGGDRLSVFVGSPLKSPFSDVFSWGGRYKKVLNTSGLTMELSHSFTKAHTGFVADPARVQPNGTLPIYSFRAETDGSSTTGSLIYPWVLSGDEELSSRLDLSYLDANNELFPAAGQALQNTSTVRLKLPSVSLGTNYEKEFKKGSFRAQARLTKGGDPLPGARRSTQANANRDATKTFGAVNLNFFVVNLGVGGSVRLMNRLDLLTSAAVQWNPDEKTLPDASKMAISSGGFVGQSLSGDEGIVGEIGLGYRFKVGTLPVRDLRARVFTSRGALRNDGRTRATDRSISIGDVGMGLDVALPSIGRWTPPTVGLVWTKAYRGPVRDKSGRFVFQLAAKF